MRIEKFIAELHADRARRAVEYLSMPSRRDTFEYGERCGIIQGLQIAEAILDRLLKEEEESGQIKR